MRSYYALSGFLLCGINRDPEFEPLRHALDTMQILLNNMGHGNHVLKDERFVRTTKDSCRYGFDGTPFKKLPIALTIGLVLVAIFWNNSVAAEDRVPRSIRTEGIITSRSLNFHKHCQINFGSYVINRQGK